MTITHGALECTTQGPPPPHPLWPRRSSEPTCTGVCQNFVKLWGRPGLWDNVLLAFTLKLNTQIYFLWCLHAQFSGEPHNLSQMSTSKEPLAPNMFRLVQLGSHCTGSPLPPPPPHTECSKFSFYAPRQPENSVINKSVHNEARTVDKRAVGIQLECFLVNTCFHGKLENRHRRRIQLFLGELKREFAIFLKIVAFKIFFLPH